MSPPKMSASASVRSIVSPAASTRRDQRRGSRSIVPRTTSTLRVLGIGSTVASQSPAGSRPTRRKRSPSISYSNRRTRPSCVVSRRYGWLARTFRRSNTAATCAAMSAASVAAASCARSSDANVAPARTRGGHDRRVERQHDVAGRRAIVRTARDRCPRVDRPSASPARSESQQELRTRHVTAEQRARDDRPVYRNTRDRADADLPRRRC